MRYIDSRFTYLLTYLLTAEYQVTFSLLTSGCLALTHSFEVNAGEYHHESYIANN